MVQWGMGPYLIMALSLPSSGTVLKEDANANPRHSHPSLPPLTWKGTLTLIKEERSPGPPVGDRRSNGNERSSSQTT